MSTAPTHDSIRSSLDNAISQLEELLAGHDNIRADDDQYEDPEEWWARPLLADLLVARERDRAC